MAAPFTRTKGLPPRIRNPQSEFRNSVSSFRGDVAAARLDGELALRLLDGGRDFQTELAHGAVPFFVRRGEAHAVARAQVLDEFGERAVEVFRLVVEDFAARLVGEVVDSERADLEGFRYPSRRHHHALLPALA